MPLPVRLGGVEMKDFFVSYNKADKAWGESPELSR